MSLNICEFAANVIVIAATQERARAVAYEMYWEGEMPEADSGCLVVKRPRHMALGADIDIIWINRDTAERAPTLQAEIVIYTQEVEDLVPMLKMKTSWKYSHDTEFYAAAEHIVHRRDQLSGADTTIRDITVGVANVIPNSTYIRWKVDNTLAKYKGQPNTEETRDKMKADIEAVINGVINGAYGNYGPIPPEMCVDLDLSEKSCIMHAHVYNKKETVDGVEWNDIIKEFDDEDDEDCDISAADCDIQKTYHRIKESLLETDAGDCDKVRQKWSKGAHLSKDCAPGCDKNAANATPEKMDSGKSGHYA